MEAKKYILGCYYGYHANNKFKTFLDLGRSSGLAYFSARGLQQKYGCEPNKFFRKDFINTESELYPAFAAALKAELDSMHHMTREAIERNSNGYLTSATNTQTSLNMSDNSAQVETVKTVVNNLPSVKVTEVKQESKNINAGLMFNLNVGEIVNGAVEDYINKSGILDKVHEQILAEAAKLRPNAITIGSRPTVTINGKLHHKFTESLKKLNRFKQIYICGPAGTGKTTLAAQCAKALGLKFGHISCSGGISEGHLIGKSNHAGEYIPALFTELYENGGLFLLDEVDAADENTLIVINSALANGHMSVPSRKENNMAKRHENFYCVCAANTWGRGSNEFSGRVVLDKAFLDRFAGAKVFVDYDTELEIELSVSHPSLVVALHKIRENCTENKVQQTVSTRAIVNGVIAMSDGDSLKTFIKDLTIDWTTQEKAKALSNVSLN